MVRAIEGGYSILDLYEERPLLLLMPSGNVRDSMSYFEKNDKIMISSHPTRRVWILFVVLGDIFPIVLILFLEFVGIRFYNI